MNLALMIVEKGAKPEQCLRGGIHEWLQRDELWHQFLGKERCQTPRGRKVENTGEMGDRHWPYES